VIHACISKAAVKAVVLLLQPSFIKNKATWLDHVT